ncbi:MAG: FtsW/RodA/SpoVE family cell cycle protein [Clostridia bacterium]|nr:FtsW/RodA/SpoVE family cell cycle protein [Clostridia bacterium]
MAVKEKEQLKLIVKKKALDYGLLVVVLVLLAIGLVMILSASAPYSLRTEGDSYFYVKKQLIFAVIGIACMLFISKIDYRILNSRLSYLAYIGGLGLMALVLIPGIGVERNGALRWVNIAGFQFQPSEVMKIGLILILATLIAKEPGKIKNFWTRFSSNIMCGFTCFWIISYSRSLKCDDDNCSYSGCNSIYSRS